MTAPRISVVLPVYAPTVFLRNLAEFAIRTLRTTAAQPFELIVVEVVHRNLDPERKLMTSWRPHDVDPNMRVDKYIHFPEKIGGVREFNAGIDAAEGEFILSTGTDIITPGDWDLELLRIFDARKDCGAATLSAYEPNYTIGPPGPIDLVVEGMFSPFTMYRRGWRFDEAYERVYCDSDIIMRLYEAGLRSYRSCRKHVWHLGSVTNTQADPEHVANHARALADDERLFYERWGNSPLAIFGMIRGGIMVYGREFDAWTKPINLHYDPKEQAS